MTSRHMMTVNGLFQRDAVCKLLQTFKRFGLVPPKTRWYINAGILNFVDVIYEA